MAKKEKEKKVSWFKRSMRIVGMNPTSFEEWWRVKINNLQFISIIIILITILFGINYVIFAYTPLGYLLPEESKDRNRKKIEEFASKVDTLEVKMMAQDKYITNLQGIILGEIPMDSLYSHEPEDSVDMDIHVKLDTSITDVERELDENIKEQAENLKQSETETFNHLFLFDPVKGTISQRFKIPNHPGVDIVTPKDTKIKACLGGIVIHSSYDNNDGYSIIISHENNIISVYKHAKNVFVKVGDKVKTGESIGVVGNTGERTTGPHLHFELWSDVGPINPMDYFSFRK